MFNPAYLHLKRTVENAILDLSLNEALHLIIDKKSVNVLLEYDISTIKKAMSMIKRNFPKYYFEYECQVNCVSITITRKSFYELTNNQP